MKEPLLFVCLKVLSPVFKLSFIYACLYFIFTRQLSLHLKCYLCMLFIDCYGLFLRHTESGKCITRSEELVYKNAGYALPYFVVMTDNCLDVKAQFRYLNPELLQNIESGGMLMTAARITNTDYNKRWAVYKGVATKAKNTQNGKNHYLQQTNSRSLSLHNLDVCAEPSINSKTSYVMRTAISQCKETKHEFTFGKWNV